VGRVSHSIISRALLAACLSGALNLEFWSDAGSWGALLSLCHISVLVGGEILRSAYRGEFILFAPTSTVQRRVFSAVGSTTWDNPVAETWRRVWGGAGKFF